MKTAYWEWAGDSLERKEKHLDELGPHDIRLQVLYSSLSSQVVGKVVKLGAKVGQRKLNDIVGVHISKKFNNKSNYSETLTQYIDITDHDAIFLPHLPLEESVCLLSTGLSAYTSLARHCVRGAHVAIIGSGTHAHLLVQFAKREFGLQVTLFGEVGEPVDQKEELGNALMLNGQFDTVILAQPLTTEEFANVFEMVAKKGKLIVTVRQTCPVEFGMFEIVVNEKEIVGVSGGTVEEAVHMLDAAVRNRIKGKCTVFAFEEAKEAVKAHDGSKSVILKIN